MGLGLVGLLSEQASALDNIERAIIKCRTSSSTTLDQISCLETALRTHGKSEGKADWVGKSAPITKTPKLGGANTSIVDAPKESKVAADIPTVTNPATKGRLNVGVLGAEQISSNRREKSLTREESRVADFAFTQAGQMIIVLANGQVWKQNASDLNSVKLAKGATPNVVVRAGKVSGYRMEFPAQKKTLIVSRIQ